MKPVWLRAGTLTFSLQIIVVGTSSWVHASEESTQVRSPETEAAGEARRLFDEGQKHYALGEYDQAIADFRRAYELSSAPGLLFNVAQAHRLKGNCQQALEVYRHFVRLAPSSPHRAEADGHVAVLVVQCGTEAALAPSVADAKSAPPQNATTSSSPGIESITSSPAPPSPRSWSQRRKLGAALLGAGLVGGATSASVYWWNDQRYDSWRTEDRLLAAPSMNVTAEEWITRQQNNDALLASIGRADNISLALAGLSLTCLLVSALVSVVLGG